MPLIPTWYPPSREHWEIVTFLWQFFPVVRYAIRGQRMSVTNPSFVAHFVPMVHKVLSHGQNLDSIYTQHSGEIWVGYYGGSWLHHAFILDVRSAESGGH